MFPGSNVRCSSGQKSHLRAAWQEAYSYTKRALNLLDHIAAQPTGQDRGRLWEQDFAGYAVESPSPQRYFGAYNAGRFDAMRSVLRQARRRYEGKTMYLITCSTVCRPKWASAQHIVRGRIVTCKPFWRSANLQDSAFTLMHEVLHHIHVKVGDVHEPVGDYHIRGVPDGFYYGIEDVTYLARHAPGLAIRNPDSYAFFAVQANMPATERFTSVYASKESSGTGGMFRDQTWTQLHALKKQQAAGGQYLADVETYVRGGRRVFAALWRIGSGDGHLTIAERGAFKSSWLAMRRDQDLIDLEVYREGGKWVYLGVFRKRDPGAAGVGGLQVGLSWQQVVARHSEFAKKGAYLSDLETYLEGDTRRYDGVWRVGAGAGALYQSTSEKQFQKVLDDRRASQQLIDIERFRSDGHTTYLGVWRHAPFGIGFGDDDWPEFASRWQRNSSWYTLIDFEVESTLPREY